MKGQLSPTSKVCLWERRGARVLPSQQTLSPRRKRYCRDTGLSAQADCECWLRGGRLRGPGASTGGEILVTDAVPEGG